MACMGEGGHSWCGQSTSEPELFMSSCACHHVCVSGPVRVQMRAYVYKCAYLQVFVCDSMYVGVMYTCDCMCASIQSVCNAGECIHEHPHVCVLHIVCT